MSIERKRQRLKWLGVLILLAGLSAAVALYVTAAGEAEEALAYEFVDGVAYPVLASESKAYRHDLERLGGKTALLADDLQRGFASLWHGTRLAWSVGVLAGAAAAVCFAAARRPPQDGGGGETREGDNPARRESDRRDERDGRG